MLVKRGDSVESTTRRRFAGPRLMLAKAIVLRILELIHKALVDDVIITKR